MTSLPPENAPQLGTCEFNNTHEDCPHPQETWCDNWKPVAAPENQPRPSAPLAICVRCAKEIREKSDIEPGAHPPPDEDWAERWAQDFHDTYEKLAPAFSYKTREASAKPWDQVPANNRQLMKAVVAEVLRRFENRRARTPQPASSEKGTNDDK